MLVLKLALFEADTQYQQIKLFVHYTVSCTVSDGSHFAN